MVFGKGVDPVPQAIVQKQQAHYIKEQAERDAVLQREGKQAEMMNVMLQNIATQGVGDILGRQKEARDWERRQAELDIREDMLIRQESRAEERGIESAQRKRMITLEEEMVKLAAQSEEEIRSQLSIEILSGLRSQSSWASAPVSEGGSSVDSELANTIKNIKDLDDLDLKEGDESYQQVQMARHNLVSRMNMLQSEANAERQMREEGHAAVRAIHKRSGSRAGMLPEDRKALMGPGGWVDRVAIQRGKVIERLMQLRRAQHEVLRLKMGGPELPEALRRNAAFQDESVSAAAAQALKRKQEEEKREDRPPAGDEDRPGRPRKPRRPRVAVLPETSDTSTTRERDAVSDARHLTNLANVANNPAYDPDVFGAVGVPGASSPLEIAENFINDLETKPLVRDSTGYGDPLTASTGLGEAVNEDRKAARAGVDAELKNLLLAHTARGRTLTFAQEQARVRGVDLTLKFLMRDPAYMRLMEKVADGAEPPPNMVLDMVTRGSQMFEAFQGQDVETFVQNNKQYRSAYRAIKESKRWSTILQRINDGRGRPISISDVMGYAMIEEVAQYMDTHDIQVKAETPIRSVEVVSAGPEDLAPHPKLSPGTNIGAASMLEREALAALASLNDGPAALYAVAAGRANTGSRLGRASPNWGHGKNGLRLKEIVDDAVANNKITTLYSQMLARARKENLTVTRNKDSVDEQTVIMISWRNYMDFQRQVRSAMKSRISGNETYQTLVLMGRR